MSKLQDRLERIRANFSQQAPAEAKNIMSRATADLSASGILDRIPQAGAELPPFDLPDSQGKTWTSAGLLEQGPLVLTVYRGVW